MKPSITVIASLGDAASTDHSNTAEAVSLLQQIPEASVTPIEGERGLVTDAGKVLEWVIEFGSNVTDVADTIIKVGEKCFAGSTLEVTRGDTTIKVTNANRDDLIALLREIRDMAEDAEPL